jgi:hypothetical protein
MGKMKKIFGRFNPATRITGSRQLEISEKVREYGIKRLALATGKAYSTICQKINGFQFLYEQDAQDWERIMSQ